MPVVINSLDKIKKRLKINDNGPAQAFMTDTCAKHMDRFVPKRDKTLRDTVVKNGKIVRQNVTVNQIIYDQEYASYQYFGKRKDGSRVIKHWTTPGTGKKWDKKMLSVDKDKIVREVQKFIDRGGK